MFRVYFPNLDIDIQNESVEVLKQVVAEIKSDNYRIEETGWVVVYDPRKSLDTDTEDISVSSG